MADAEVKIGADATALERAANVSKAAIRDLGSSMTSAIGSAAQAVVNDLSQIALASGKISFSSQHQQVKEFEAASARLAVASHADQESLRRDYEATGVATGKRPGEVAAWAREVGALTYNLKGAGDGFRGINALAAETGRAPETYRALAAELGTVGRVTGDTTHMIGVLAAQADKMGTKGGIAAFADQIEGLGDVISHFRRESESDFTKITALAATLGKGLEPAEAKRVTQGAMGALASDPVGWSRYLGRDIQDAETGQVKDPGKVLHDVVEKVERTWGKGAQALRVLRVNLGAETGTAAFNAYNRGDLSKLNELGGVAPSSAPAEAQKAYLATDAGKREVADAHLAESSRALMGSSTMLGRAADSLQRFASQSPISSTMISSTVGIALGGFMTKFGTTLATMMGGKGAGGAVGGVLQIAKGGAAGPMALAGAAAEGALVYGLEKYDEYADERDKGKLSDEDKKIRALKAERDRVRAAKGWKPVGVPVAEPTSGGAPQAAQTAPASADQLAQKQADTSEQATKIAAAVKEAMKGLMIVNATGGAVAIADASGASAASGSQAHP